MDISRLCMAATLFPFASLKPQAAQLFGGLVAAGSSQISAQPNAADMRQARSATRMTNITSSFVPEPLSTRSLDGWEKTRDADGIRIYARTDPGKAFQRLRGEFEMPGTEQDALNALMDPDHFIDWLDGMAEITVRDREPNDKAFTLNAVSKAANLLVYTIPAREIALRCERNDAPKGGGTQLTMKMLPPPKKPSKDRIYADAFDGEVSIKPKGKNNVAVSFSCYFEPGGSLPAFAVNRVSAGSVFKSMTNARNRITEVQNKG